MTFPFTLAIVLAVGAGKPTAAVTRFALLDSAGNQHTSAAWKEHKAIVLVFRGTECPVSNGYAPEYRRLAERYRKKGVRFYGVHPDPDLTAAAVGKHAAEYRIPFPV